MSSLISMNFPFLYFVVADIDKVFIIIIIVSYWWLLSFLEDNRSLLFSESDAYSLAIFTVHHHLFISCSYLKLCLSKIGTRWPRLVLSRGLFSN